MKIKTFSQHQDRDFNFCSQGTSRPKPWSWGLHQSLSRSWCC